MSFRNLTLRAWDRSYWAAAILLSSWCEMSAAAKEPFASFFTVKLKQKALPERG